MINRRNFMVSAAATAGAVAAGVGYGRSESPNESIGLGFVGVGWRGGQLIEAFHGLPGVRIAALCDADEDRLNNLSQVSEQLRGKLAATPKFVDMRKLLEQPDVDAVVIATGNYWHCLAAIWACQAGKDVYVEKPLGHNLWEQRQLLKAALANNRVVQVGTQQRSSSIQEPARQLLHEDQVIGKPLHVVVSRVGERKPIGKRSTPLTPPKSVNYNLWLGPAPKQAIYRDALHYDWHWDFNTGNGEMGNWGVHVLDDVLNVALQDKAGWPTSVSAAGMRAKWDDAGNTPNVQIAHYQNRVLPVTYLMSNIVPAEALVASAKYQGFVTGYTVFAEGGRYEGTRGQGRFVDSEGKVIKHLKGDSGTRHQRNFLQAVRTRDPSILAANLEIGHVSTGWCHLANIAALEGLAEGAQQEVSGPDIWSSLYAGYQSQIAAWDKAAIVRPAGAIEVDPVSGEIGPVAAPEARQFIKRTFRTHQWEREFEVA